MQALFVVLADVLDVVMNDADPEPAVALERFQTIGEPAVLRFSGTAIVHVVAMAFSHRRVDAGDDHLELIDLEERPWLVGGKDEVRLVLVETLKEGSVLFPLWPIGRQRLLIVRFTLFEVSLTR